ncbi:MAG: single-stranded DNA-binding protein [Deferribacteraceae bacterium]|jgi:single-strand DNA-binding protein|nr:single-stranded DNA-binding protein [Deferribacteraceae bacterium]
MASFNKVVLLGNLTRDPELRYTQGNDLPVARSGLAVNSKYKNKEEVMFIDFVVFGKLAEVLNSYATKGSPLLIEGRLQLNTWEKDGQRHSRHEIIVESFQLIGSKRDREEASSSGMHNSGNFSSAADTGDDDDIPF